MGAAAGAALDGGIGYYMDAREAKLWEKMQETGVNMTRNGDNIVLYMSNNVTFDSSSANLKPAGTSTLTGVAMVLKHGRRESAKLSHRNHPEPAPVSPGSNPHHRILRLVSATYRAKCLI